MKYLIVGDFHNVRLKEKLETLIEREKPDCLISLGDYDIIDSILDFLEISEKCEGQGIQVIDVPGNHDHAILNNFYIESPTLTSLNTDIDTLHSKLQETPRARQYLEKALCHENITKRLEIGKFNVVIVHGAYNGDIKSLGDKDKDELVNRLWYRLLDSRDICSNFDEMARLKENIMIRGHDHWQFYATFCRGSVIIDYYSKAIPLGRRPMHVICPGAFYEGCYAVLEQRKNKLKVLYKNLL